MTKLPDPEAIAHIVEAAIRTKDPALAPCLSAVAEMLEKATEVAKNYGDPAAQRFNNPGTLKAGLTVEVQLHHKQCSKGVDNRGIWPLMEPLEQTKGMQHWQRGYRCPKCEMQVIASLCETK